MKNQVKSDHICETEVKNTDSERPADMLFNLNFRSGLPQNSGDRPGQSDLF